MASIGRSPIKTSHTAATADTATLGSAEAKTGTKGTKSVDGQADPPPVNRGFSNQNSYSRVEGEETIKSQAQPPALDEPKEGAGSDKAANEILKTFEQEKGASQKETIQKSVDDFQKKPLGQQIANLQNKKGELTKMGFSEAQIDGMTSMADPTDENNSLSSIHSSSARMNSMIEGEGKEAKLYSVFEDVLVKFGALVDVPEDLQKELEADFKALTKAVFNAEAPLDVDSATTMLVEIQSKLQNERLKFDQEAIKIGQLSVEHRSRKIIHKIRDAIAKVEKAKKTQLLGKIFGWIAVAVMAVATAIVVAVGIIFTGGVLSAIAITAMVAATALILTMMISSETGDWMNKIFDSFAGEDKSKVRMGAMIFWTSLVILLSLGGAIAGGFAGGAGAGAAAAGGAASGASGGATATATAGNTAATAATTAAKFASLSSKLSKILQVIQGAATVAEGSAGVANSVYTYEADILRAEALEQKGEMLRIQQAINDAIEAVQTVIDELQQGYSVLTSIMKAEHDTKTTLARKLGA